LPSKLNPSKEKTEMKKFVVLRSTKPHSTERLVDVDDAYDSFPEAQQRAEQLLQLTGGTYHIFKLAASLSITPQWKIELEEK
jgi:hypothetical protein